MLIASIGVYAQQTISGCVIDQNSKEPIVGGAVIIKGTSSGTITDIDGIFTINIC